EYGRGNYESHLDDGTVGSGTGQSFGVGVMARQTNDNGFYYEGSLRYGKSTSTYSSNNLLAGKTISYDNSANYWGAHAGVGKVVELSGDNSLDLYGKLFYTRQGASSVNVDGDTLDFSAVNSKRSRIGFRYIHGTSKVRSVYAGLAWQYEFDGAAYATANGFSTPSPSVKGSSGMLELGVLIAPKASPVSFDLGVSGWTGKQKGYSLNANMCWSF
ncbi:MAG: autotransporter outer membrane beta-barrel domain-containing protein, partial [Selenomonadaceae bacterium]|nr:autotransporter outer membrane beta-barrel domain-containing protein [Selenomonadaceae bacterium]